MDKRIEKKRGPNKPVLRGNYKSWKRWKWNLDSFSIKYIGTNILEDAKPQEFENAIAEKPGIWGIKVQKTDEIVFEPQFLYEPQYAFFDTFVVYKGKPWEKAGEKYHTTPHQCGVIDLKGNEVVPFEYEHIKVTWKIGSAESEKKYIVCQNQKWGVINKNNEVVIPLEYDKIVEDLKTEEYRFICQKDGKIEYITLSNATKIETTSENQSDKIAS